MRQLSSNNQTIAYAKQPLNQQPAATSHGPGRWLWLAAVVVALLLGYTVGHLGTNKGASTTPPSNTTQQVTTGQSSTTQGSTTQGSTTQGSTTQGSTTQGSTSQSSTTQSGQQAVSGSQIVSNLPVVSTVHTWTTIFSYHSTGNRQTEVFTAPKSWSLQWQCNPASNSIKQYNLVVAIYGSDGTLMDPAALNTICKAGNTTDMSLKSVSGKIYLDVFSQGEWTLNIQQLK